MLELTWTFTCDRCGEQVEERFFSQFPDLTENKIPLPTLPRNWFWEGVGYPIKIYCSKHFITIADRQPKQVESDG